VVSPDVVVRFKEGRIVVHTAFRPAHLLFDSMEIVSVLAFFRCPREQREALEVFPEAPLDTLQGVGVLIPAEPPSEASGGGANAGAASAQVVTLARALDSIAGDLDAFDPSTLREIVRESGISVAARIQSALAAVDALRGELCARRQGYVRAQLDKLGIGPDVEHLKLHIGAGRYPLDGWLNIDRYPAQLALDIRWGLPFADGAADFAFLSHTLEHFYYPHEALNVVREIRRVLSASGMLRVIVPDIEKCLCAYVEQDGEFFSSRRKTWTWWPEAATRLEDFLAYAGAGPEFGFAGHKFGYDFETLRHLLHNAGFRQVERSAYMQSAHAELRHDDASAVAGAMYREQHYSLFVEAVA